MRRLTTLLTAIVLLTACSGGLSGIAKKTAVCCMEKTLTCSSSKEPVCATSSEAEEETDDDSAPVLLTGFLIHR